MDKTSTHDVAAAVVCDLVVPGVFFAAVIALAAGEVENVFDVRFEALTKQRTAVRAGVVRSMVREGIVRGIGGGIKEGKAEKEQRLQEKQGLDSIKRNEWLKRRPLCPYCDDDIHQQQRAVWQWC